LLIKNQQLCRGGACPARNIGIRNMYNLANLDVVILCGGKGERLQSVLSDKPKALADIAGRPFLAILIDNLKKFGFERFILSVGYKREDVIEYFKDRGTIVFSQEENALGTGGGLKKAQNLIESDTFLAMNGDSFCDLDFNQLFSFHNEKEALLTIALTKAPEAKDYGTVSVDATGKIKSFQEKVERNDVRLVSAGIYFMNKEIFNQMPQEEVFSLEYDLFPKTKDSFGYLTEAKLYDIGTPERYEQAKQMLSERS